MDNLTLEELYVIKKIFESSDNTIRGFSELYGQVESLIEVKEELSTMDFDDCTGGACKL